MLNFHGWRLQYGRVSGEFLVLGLLPSIRRARYQESQVSGEPGIRRARYQESQVSGEPGIRRVRYCWLYIVSILGGCGLARTLIRWSSLCTHIFCSKPWPQNYFNSKIFPNLRYVISSVTCVILWYTEPWEWQATHTAIESLLGHDPRTIAFSVGSSSTALSPSTFLRGWTLVVGPPLICS